MNNNLIIQKADGSLVPIQNRRTATRQHHGQQRQCDNIHQRFQEWYRYGKR